MHYKAADIDYPLHKVSSSNYNPPKYGNALRWSLFKSKFSWSHSIIIARVPFYTIRFIKRPKPDHRMLEVKGH